MDKFVFPAFLLIAYCRAASYLQANPANSYPYKIYCRTSSMDHSARVKNGNRIERDVCRIFGLKGNKKRGKNQPDILDEGCVGEVKSFSKCDKIVVFTDQYKRYTKLAENLNHEYQTLCEGKPFSLYYFFAKYDSRRDCGNAPKQETLDNETLPGDIRHVLTDVYVVDSISMENIIEQKDDITTKWGLPGSKLSEISCIEDEHQKMMKDYQTMTKRKKRKGRKSDRENLAKEIIKKNKKTYVRVPEREIYVLCQNGIQINENVTIHYTEPAGPFVEGLLENYSGDRWVSYPMVTNKVPPKMEKAVA